jgi:hypothetical protein
MTPMRTFGVPVGGLAVLAVVGGWFGVALGLLWSGGTSAVRAATGY